MGDNDLLMAILMTLQYLEQERDYHIGALKEKGLTSEAFATQDAFNDCIGAIKSTLEECGISQGALKDA